MNVGSLFAGIGGFDLGLQRAGMRTLWFCEQNPYRQRILARHWPGVPIHSDVRALVADTPRNGEAGNTAAAAAIGERTGLGDQPGGAGGTLPVPVPYVDVLCAGWPCPGFSHAGRGEGFDHAGSGLWTEIVRLLPQLRPRYLVLENVAALLGRGLGRVLGDLAALGYDAEWDCLPASAFGAPHRRDRVWIVAYPDETGLQGRAVSIGERSEVTGAGNGGALADPEREGRESRRSPRRGDAQGAGPYGGAGRRGASGQGQWLVEPNVGRVAHGVPNRVDRLAALGDSLVPQIAEWIGHRIMEAEGVTTLSGS